MNSDLTSIPLQPITEEVYGKKYQLKTKDDVAVDQDIEQTYVRVALALADVEAQQKPDDFGAGTFWFERFLFALQNGATPAGRIMSNVGAGKYKPETSTINCIVSETVSDSMESIGSALKEEGMTLRAGCGIGYEFSTLRPKGALVNGVGAATSGPLSFMDVFDSFCSTISSAGGRRGAQMATFDIRHPDVLDFIKAKRENGRLRKFNVSVLLTDEFIKAVQNGTDWVFAFPARKDFVELEKDNDNEYKFLRWLVTNPEDYDTDADGKILCKVYGSMPARKIWDTIMDSAYDYSEPGIIMIDRINHWNNNWFCENIRATNPCGEQPLPPNGACLLGSVNLTKFVSDPFTDDANFDFDKYVEVVSVFTRMLDNVVELNGLPLQKQKDEIFRKRRHGMGILGLGSALCMLKIKYGSQRAVEFTENVMRLMVVEGWKQCLEIGREKGVAPIMNEQFTVTSEMLNKNMNARDACQSAGKQLTGKQLLFKFSNYIKALKDSDDLSEQEKEIFTNLEFEGGRFTHHTSIAPTGTIALALGNNCSNGIEPSFAHAYNRNLTQENKSTRQTQRVYSYELLAYKHLVDPDADGENLPDYFVEADTVDPKRHLDMQIAAQKWVDSSISKTINVPTEIPFEDFKDIYMYGIGHGVKGTTVFRFNPETLQGVLTKDKDLKSTLYKFILDDGSELEVTGEELIEYKGELHSAAMLFDAIKEGAYGKY